MFQRLIKTDLYKMGKSLSTWIILLFSCIVYIVMFFVSSSTFGGSISFLEQTSKVLFGDFIAMFVTIFISIFWYTDYKNGYIKNIWSVIENKLHYIISKVLCVAVYLVAEYIILMLISVVFNLVYLKNNQIGEWLPFLNCLLCQFILNISFGSIIVLVNCLLRNHAVTIAACIAYVTIAPITVYSAINLILKNMVHETAFSIGNYLPYGNLYVIVSDSPTSDYVRAYIVSVAFIFFSVLCSYLLLRKREIK